MPNLESQGKCQGKVGKFRIAEMPIILLVFKKYAENNNKKVRKTNHLPRTDYKTFPTCREHCGV